MIHNTPTLRQIKTNTRREKLKRRGKKKKENVQIFILINTPDFFIPEDLGILSLRGYSWNTLMDKNAILHTPLSATGSLFGLHSSTLRSSSVRIIDSDIT
ncbi:hypothetical protein TNIN_148621 [Trichonephila inaurata madagascariensis]|uniref:Uncharacterized protein n=1 Tax=Trichonephila inaurata madagascariensis TaxID=2747483 RepID=A0A8X6WX90_9ARAC|nr:hypothetical protein TNIN_148621 [Trichonephila inaurata madagascariensis]